MKIENGENYIDMEVSLEKDDSLPSYGDAHITIAVHSNGFSGRNDVWVMAEEFRKFCISLVRLEKNRKGEAALNSISPGELDLKIYSKDCLGHLAVSVTTGCSVANIHHSVTFGFEFEPAQLVKAIETPWVSQSAE